MEIKKTGDIFFSICLLFLQLTGTFPNSHSIYCFSTILTHPLLTFSLLSPYFLPTLSLLSPYYSNFMLGFFFTAVVLSGRIIEDEAVVDNIDDNGLIAMDFTLKQLAAHLI